MINKSHYRVIDNINLELSTLNNIISNMNTANFILLEEIIKLHQKTRVSKQYELSDQLRNIIDKAGYKIIQGTGGLSRDEIKNKYTDKNIPLPQSQDTYKLKE